MEAWEDITPSILDIRSHNKEIEDEKQENEDARCKCTIFLHVPHVYILKPYFTCHDEKSRRISNACT